MATLTLLSALWDRAMGVGVEQGGCGRCFQSPGRGEHAGLRGGQGLGVQEGGILTGCVWAKKRKMEVPRGLRAVTWAAVQQCLQARVGRTRECGSETAGQLHHCPCPFSFLWG